MSAWRRALITIVTCLVMAFARRTAAMRDHTLALYIRFARLFVRDRSLRAAMGDLLDILAEGPPGTVILRKMLGGIQLEEARDLVRGALFFEEIDPIDYP